MYCSTCLSPLFIGSGGKKGEKALSGGGWKSFGIFVAQLGRVGKFWPWRRRPQRTSRSNPAQPVQVRLPSERVFLWGHRMYVIYRIDSQRRRLFARLTPADFPAQRSIQRKQICGAWTYAPEYARHHASEAEAQLAAEQMSVAIRRPGAMLVTTLAEAVERASKGWTRRNNRSTVRTGG